MEAEKAMILCKLCLTDCPELETSTLQSCNCVFCVQCLRQYVQLAIRGGAGSAITCPDPACKNTATLLDSELALFAPSDQVELYQRLRFERGTCLSMYVCMHLQYVRSCGIFFFHCLCLHLSCPPNSRNRLDCLWCQSKLHYDKGPCRNKLGHSRASVMWNRTQVVGILVGVSIIVLVTSPLLLLASPCILCCVCKPCQAKKIKKKKKDKKPSDSTA
uniref:RBR-type E3 ubiquitin transferase n=1 Tax=Cyprinus carpio TaxID=7962 RepID=A0A8C2CJP8_CYPCA